MITRRLLALVLLLTVGSASCSFIVMSRPPDPPQQHIAPTCTSSRLPPVLDLLIGVPYLAAGLILIVAGSQEDDAFFDGDAFVAMGALVGAFGGLMTWSGFTGLDIANDCDHAERLYEAYINSPAGRYGYGSYPQPQQPQIRPGYEGGQCGWQNWCAPGLTCASDFCVRLPPVTPAPPPPAPPAPPPAYP